MGGILVHDEELAACGVGHHGAGHGEHAALMLDVVDDAVELEFALDGMAGAAHAGAGGVAALDHEALDDPVEDQAVIEALLGEGQEIVNGDGCDLGVQLGTDDAAVLHFDLDDGICHEIIPPYSDYL